MKIILTIYETNIISRTFHAFQRNNFRSQYANQFSINALFLLDFDIRIYAHFYQFLKHFTNIVMILCHCCVF